tara:strand:+ start:1045 stop:1209 length:165 start_codon:yes stop_codon:yes gene_type:complete
MEENTKFEVENGVLWQILVERHRLPVVLDQQKFIHPVDDKKVDASNRVQDRHAA